MDLEFKSDCLQSTVCQDFKKFQDLVTLAGDFLKKRHYPLSAVCAQIAAQYAFFHHPGIFVSSRLEEVLLNIGHNTMGREFLPESHKKKDKTPNHLLHVLSYGRDIGGDTRFVWRWIQADTERHHSVALLRQGNIKVPQKLLDSVLYAQGKLHILNSSINDHISAAKALREISQGVDLIVLHLFPDEIIPLIAFAEKSNFPPIILLNHADHMFWLGVNISDVVVNLRACRDPFSVRRRGMNDERIGFLPIPLVPACRTFSRSQAKRQLGFSEDTILILSIASSFKYEPISGPSFVDVIAPVIEKYKNAALIAIGPDNCGPWRSHSQKTQGRIMALGKRSDTTLFYEAADIYLDSFPFTSITSLLEAGSYDMPLVSYDTYQGDALLLGAGAPGLTDTLIRVKDLESYIYTVSRLIEDYDFREQTGNITRERILALHTGKGWGEILQELYAKASSILPIDTKLSGSDEQFLEELDVMVNCLYSHSDNLAGIIERFVRPLPYGLRIQLLIKMLSLNRSFPFGLFLPMWLEKVMETRVKWWRSLPGVTKWLEEKI